MADAQPPSASLGTDAAMSEAAAHATIQIHIKTMAQSTHHVRILPTATVSDLKTLLSETIPESPVAQQRIIYRGRALADTQVLSAAGVVEDSTIHMVLRPADAPPLPIPQAPGAAPVQGMRFPMGTQVMGGPGGQMFNMVFENMGGGGLGGFRFGGMDAAQQQQAGAAGAAGNETEEEAQFAAATMNEVSNALNGLFSSIMGGAAAAGAVAGPPLPTGPLPPHLITSLSSYINRLDDPLFAPPPFPLTSHSLLSNQVQAGTPALGVNAAVDAAHVNLTSALQRLLSSPATPYSPGLQELLTRSAADPTGRSPPSAPVPQPSTSAITTTTTTTTTADTESASTATTATISTETAAATPLPTVPPAGQGADLLSSLPAVSAALAQQQLQQQQQQQLHANTPYAYTSLAVAALSQLLTRSLTHVESTPEVIRLMAQALDAANESLAQQQLQLLSTAATPASTTPTPVIDSSSPDSSSPEPAATPTTAAVSTDAPVATGAAAAAAAATSPATDSSAAGEGTAVVPAAPRSESDVLAEALQHCASHLAARSALLLELARLSMATSLALTGNSLALAGNAVSVVELDGSAPAYPRLLPRGGMAMAPSQPRVRRGGASAAHQSATAGAQAPAEGAAGQAPAAGSGRQSTDAERQQRRQQRHQAHAQQQAQQQQMMQQMLQQQIFAQMQRQQQQTGAAGGAATAAPTAGSNGATPAGSAIPASVAPGGAAPLQPPVQQQQHHTFHMQPIQIVMQSQDPRGIDPSQIMSMLGGLGGLGGMIGAAVNAAGNSAGNGAGNTAGNGGGNGAENAASGGVQVDAAVPAPGMGGGGMPSGMAALGNFWSGVLGNFGMSNNAAPPAAQGAAGQAPAPAPVPVEVQTMLALMQPVTANMASSVAGEVVSQLGAFGGLDRARLAGAVQRSLAGALQQSFTRVLSHSDVIMEGLNEMEEEAAAREGGSGELSVPDMMQGMARVVSRILEPGSGSTPPLRANRQPTQRQHASTTASVPLAPAGLSSQSNGGLVAVSGVSSAAAPPPSTGMEVDPVTAAAAGAGTSEGPRGLGSRLPCGIAVDSVAKRQRMHTVSPPAAERPAAGAGGRVGSTAAAVPTPPPSASTGQGNMMAMLQSLGGMVSSPNGGGRGIDFGALMSMANTMAQSPQMGPLIDAMMSGNGGGGGGGGGSMEGMMQGVMSALQGGATLSNVTGGAAAAAATVEGRASEQQAAAVLLTTQGQSLDQVVGAVLPPGEAERWVGVISQDAAATATTGQNGSSAAQGTVPGSVGGNSAGLSPVYLAGGEGADAARLSGPRPGGA